VNILSDNSAQNIDWGMTGSPLVVGTNLVVNPGGSQGVVAYERATGRKVWTASGGVAAYASPMLVVVNGMPCVLVYDADGVRLLNPSTGQQQSFVAWRSPMNMNSAQPTPLGFSKIMVSSEKDNGSVAYDFSTPTPKQLWKNSKFAARYASPVYHDNAIYGLTDGLLPGCPDRRTPVEGRSVWQRAGLTRGFALSHHGGTRHDSPRGSERQHIYGTWQTAGLRPSHLEHACTGRTATLHPDAPRDGLRRVADRTLIELCPSGGK
jgi:hypothetical protein